MGRSYYAHIFLGQLAAGKRLQCGPVLRYKDALKVNLKQCGIDPSALGDDTQDRSAWRTLCLEAVTQFEDSRVEVLEHKRAVRKGLNLAATSALGHVTAALTSAVPELDSTTRAGLTIWWALRTPQRRGPTGKLDAE